MKEKILTLGAILAASIVLSSSFSYMVLAETVEPPVSGVDIVDYESEIMQEAGTSVDYMVTVKNLGVLDLNPIYLSILKPISWWSSGKKIALGFNQIGELHYTLSIPENVQGVYVFGINAVGEYGELKVSSETEPVMLTITSKTHGVTETEAVAEIGIEEKPGAIEGTTTTTTTIIILPTTTLPTKTTTPEVPFVGLTAFIQEQIGNPVNQLIGVMIVVTCILGVIKFKVAVKK